MIIKHPISTEKTIKIIESENKLVFVVEPNATKSEIKEELEQVFQAKVTRINTLRTAGGEKRAIVRFDESTPAINIATKLGLM